MTTPQTDDRTPQRRERDEAIAAEDALPPPEMPKDAAPVSMESHLLRTRRPVAVAGVVENGVVRPVDPTVRLPERSRVIIVGTEPA